MIMYQYHHFAILHSRLAASCCKSGMLAIIGLLVVTFVSLIPKCRHTLMISD